MDDSWKNKKSGNKGTFWPYYFYFKKVDNPYNLYSVQGKVELDIINITYFLGFLIVSIGIKSC